MVLLGWVKKQQQGQISDTVCVMCANILTSPVKEVLNCELQFSARVANVLTDGVGWDSFNWQSGMGQLLLMEWDGTALTDGVVWNSLNW